MHHSGSVYGYLAHVLLRSVSGGAGGTLEGCGSVSVSLSLALSPSLSPLSLFLFLFLSLSLSLSLSLLSLSLSLSLFLSPPLCHTHTLALTLTLTPAWDAAQEDGSGQWFRRMVLGVRYRALGVGCRVDSSWYTSAASERRGNILKGYKDFYLKVKARIWP